LPADPHDTASTQELPFVPLNAATPGTCIALPHEPFFSLATRMHAYIALCLATGIRTEEARALRWEHINLGDPAADPPVPASAAVWRSVRAHGDTKTKKSRRTLALPQMAADALHTLKQQQAADRHAAGVQHTGQDLVFATKTGAPLDAANVRREFRAICTAANIGEHWTPRELRHSFVSLPVPPPASPSKKSPASPGTPAPAPPKSSTAANYAPSSPPEPKSWTPSSPQPTPSQAHPTTADRPLAEP
jgi:integrase